MQIRWMTIATAAVLVAATFVAHKVGADELLTLCLAGLATVVTALMPQALKGSK